MSKFLISNRLEKEIANVKVYWALRNNYNEWIVFSYLQRALTLIKLPHKININILLNVLTQ